MRIEPWVQDRMDKATAEQGTAPRKNGHRLEVDIPIGTWVSDNRAHPRSVGDELAMIAQGCDRCEMEVLADEGVVRVTVVGPRQLVRRVDRALRRARPDGR